MNGDHDKRLGRIEIDIRDIKTNHLPHIYTELARLAFLKPLTIGISVGVFLLIIGMAWATIVGGN